MKIHVPQNLLDISWRNRQDASAPVFWSCPLGPRLMSFRWRLIQSHQRRWWRPCVPWWPSWRRHPPGARCGGPWPPLISLKHVETAIQAMANLWRLRLCNSPHVSPEMNRIHPNTRIWGEGESRVFHRGTGFSNLWMLQPAPRISHKAKTELNDTNFLVRIKNFDKEIRAAPTYSGWMIATGGKMIGPKR